MSDTDADAGDDSSSDFDKEAEREKLREKFARDDEKRESTQRMSELLLQGATMTNKHCNNCGDPLFRQNGQEFCATCGAGRPDAKSSAEADEEASVTDGRAQSAESAPEQRKTAEETVERTAAAETPATRPDADEERRTPSRTAPGDDDRPSPTADEVTRAQRPGRSTETTPSPVASSGTVAGDVEGARDALVAALTRHASAGAETDDPRAARDHLSAAREAAEALSALRR